MKRRKVTAFAAVLIATAWADIGHAQPSPMPPIKPIKLATEVGSVSGSREKIEVKIKAQITRSAMELSVILTDESSLVLDDHSVPGEVLAPLAAMLDRAAESLYAGQAFADSVESIVVSTVEGNSETFVKVEFRGGFSERGHLQVDGDNAETLSRILRKAERIAAWLAERIGALQPK